MGTSRLLIDRIERIRVSFEREAYAALEAETLATTTPGALERSIEEARTKRRSVLANALLLTESMAPEAYEAAHEAMAALGIDDRIELFQSDGHGVDTARLVLRGDPIGIEFLGGYLDRLDRGALTAVLGHEIGHCLAHAKHHAFRRSSSAPVTPVRRAYAMAAEFTADRFGLLACRDLDTVLRLEIQTLVGRATRSIRVDTADYLRQSQAIAEELLASGGTLLGTSHPEHYVRTYAEWLFSETDLYRTLTGGGSARRTIEEVDATLAALIGPLREDAALDVHAHPPPSPRVPTTTKEPRGTKPPHDAKEPHDDVLAGAARRTLTAARDALATLTEPAGPPKRASGEVEGSRGATSAKDGTKEADDGADLLDEERRALIARFEELERRFGSE